MVYLYCLEETILEVAENIRDEILKNTGCIASCGIGNSILIARLATKQAKPNGKCYVSMVDVPEFISKIFAAIKFVICYYSPKTSITTIENRISWSANC